MTAAQTIAGFHPSISVKVIKSPKIKGQLEEAGNIENWPGSLILKGKGLLNMMEDKAGSNDNVDIIEDHIVETHLQGTPKVLHGERSTYFASIVILASGAEPNLPKILEPHKGTGVFTCTDCDGPRFTNKDVLVIGGGPSAIEQTINLLSLNANRVHLAVRGSDFKAEETLIKHLYKILDRSKKNLFLYFEHNLEAVHLNKDGMMNASSLRHREGRLTLPVSGVFSATGQKPLSSIYPEVCLNDKGYIQRYGPGKHLWSQPMPKSNFLTLGSIDSPFNTRLLAAAKGATSAQMLNKTATSSHWIKKRVAILGTGIGGKTAALYAKRSGFDVFLIDIGARKPMKSFWPVLKSEPSLLRGLDKQLSNLSVSTLRTESVSLIQTESHYHIQAGSYSILVDAIIANTLEYSAESLGISLMTPEDFNHEYRWSHTCLRGVFTAGDVAVQPDLPRQAITAAYSGHLAGLQALEEILAMQDHNGMIYFP